MMRKKTRSIQVGSVTIGGIAPVVIQSMTNTPTEDVEASLAQIQRLSEAGCLIVRCAVPHAKALKGFEQVCKQTTVPLVADIHFNHKLAIGAIEAGASKVRINPGNIGSEDNVKAVVDAARSAKIPIRIGVNGGSLEPAILQKHGHPTPQALLESALHNIELMHRLNFDDLCISIKATDVLTTIEACTLLSEATDVPQHIGITESGTVRTGTIRSSVGIGALLSRGIGDTIRVSLSGDPIHEIAVAKDILKALKLAHGPVVIACPTCGRTAIDVAELASRVEQMVSGVEADITIAVMGCIVNGPGEAREADVGIAGGAGEGQIFVKGEPVAKVKEEQLLEALWEQIQKVVAQKGAG
jgi:(E)-4-hydroxy-3-methylbut-2-enyl-diphosphate synthase